MIRIDTPGVMIRIASLFSQHSDFVKGFHKFFPEGYTMELLRLDYLGTVVIIIMPNGRDM
jgi:histone deacetylase complex regulatory component SIN3